MSPPLMRHPPFRGKTSLPRRNRFRTAGRVKVTFVPKTKLPFDATIVGHWKGPYRVRVHDYGMEFIEWL